MTPNSDLMVRLIKRFELNGVSTVDATRLAGLAMWELDMTGTTCLCPCHLPSTESLIK